MKSKYLRVNPDAIQPSVEALWSAVLDAKTAFVAALADDLDDEVAPRLIALQAQILLLLARPARMHQEIRYKMTTLEVVSLYEGWFPTRAAAMGKHAVEADLADLGITLDELMAGAALQ